MTEKLKGLLQNFQETILQASQIVTNEINELKTEMENQMESILNAPTAQSYAQVVTNSATGQYKVHTA